MREGGSSQEVSLKKTPTKKERERERVPTNTECARLNIVVTEPKQTSDDPETHIGCT